MRRRFVMHTCSICLNEPHQPMMVRPCRHQFCRACITHWKERKNVCPCCRGTIRKLKPLGDDFEDERRELSFKFVLLIALLAIVRLMNEFLPACWWNDLGEYRQDSMRGSYPPRVSSRWV